MSWQIEARHTDYARNIMRKRESDILGNILFDEWTPISRPYDDLTHAVHAYTQKRIGTTDNNRLYIYRIYDPATDEAIPCDIL